MQRGVYAQRAETAVLLGIRYEDPIPAPLPYYVVPADSISQAEYRTFLLVQRADGRIELIGQKPGLTLPRGSDLWLVERHRSAYNNWVEDFLSAAPLGRRAPRAGIQAYNGEFCQGHRVQVIHYAGPEYLSLEQRTAGYCEDAAHPWFSNALAVVPIDSTTHTGLPISSVLGSAASEALKAGAGRHLDELDSDQERTQFFSQPDPANWGLVRRQGRWRLRGRLDSEELASTRFADFPVDLRPPASLAGHDALYPDWTRIRAIAPDAVDAASSPGRTMLLILHPRRITVRPLRNDMVGTTAVEVEVPSGARIVSVQWTNSHVATWTKAFRPRPDRAAVGWQPAQP